MTTKIRRTLGGLMVAVVMAAGFAYYLAASHASTSPASQGYRRLATIQGETFWVKPFRGHQVQLVTSGAFGNNVCGGNAPARPSGRAICNDTAGGASAFAQVVAAGSHPIIIGQHGYTARAAVFPYGQFGIALAVANNPWLFGASIKH